MRLFIYIYIYIYLSYVLGHGANLYRVQNGQDGRPLRSHCVRLKYSPRIALKGKEIVRNETDTPTTPSGKDTGIGRRNHVNYSSYTLENFTGPLRATQILAADSFKRVRKSYERKRTLQPLPQARIQASAEGITSTILPTRSRISQNHCVRLKYSPRIASKGKEIV